MFETWIPLKDFPNYSVSNLGNVRNDSRLTNLSISYTIQGGAKVGLVFGGKQLTRSVAVLVADAFVDGYNPKFNTPIHLDGDRSNNCATNLAWRPRWFAIKYQQQFKNDYKMDYYFRTPPVYDEHTGEVYDTIGEACIINGLMFFEVMRSVVEKDRVWPSWHVFAWATLENG